MKRILAATDFSTRAHRAIRQAAVLARQSGAELTLLHIVDEEPEALVALEVAESRKILDEQIASIPELRDVQCHPSVAIGAPHDAIMKVATAVNANLIVMGCHRKQLLRDVFVGTTIERVIRTGTWPVLMVNSEAAQAYGSVLIALDLSDTSTNALSCASALGILDDARVTVVHAFDAIAKSKLAFADVTDERISAYVETEQQRATSELQGYLTSRSFDAARCSYYVAEGDPVPVISKAVDAIGPELLVVGTHGRSGVAKMLLGSVAEQLLRTMELDILAVPRRSMAS
ncbi:universal stress protein [Hyphomicrobium facile]|uniref:Nucleotide-binding universal stress protein, UspA family n=1 Tax=Hyphomicrobium facile TaxID=51670 RepID=A0A1I7NEN8_9HYPH|nr:universal stress protein [Hyphomicrobium facile]SFV33132.1 Nucleotide-binding universal stress protein, UspA family [Hyphomicrobium facile]